MTNEEAAVFMNKNGFVCTELCFACKDSKYWVYNGRSDLSGLSFDQARKIVDTYRDNEIEVVSIGVFTNLIEPDEDERIKNLEYFDRHIQIASDNGIGYAATECGFIPGRRGVSAETYEQDFDRLKKSLSYLIEKAEKYDVKIALEPCVLDVVPSAKRTADLISQLGSERIRVLLDPANLIANSSEEDMFGYLADLTAYFHGKDRRVNDTWGRALGDGDIDWSLFLRLCQTRTPDTPFILEYVKSENAVEIKSRIDKYMKDEFDS